MDPVIESLNCEAKLNVAFGFVLIIPRMAFAAMINHTKLTQWKNDPNS